MVIKALPVLAMLLFSADGFCVPPTWDELPTFQMDGGLKAFWNVRTSDKDSGNSQAVRHGFSTVDLIGTYRDDAKRLTKVQTELLQSNHTNPWLRPAELDDAVADNLGRSGSANILVHDIELQFNQDSASAYRDTIARQSSRATTATEFSEKYFEALANWYSKPCEASRSLHPRQPVGIYGIAPMGRTYYGIDSEAHWKRDNKLRQAQYSLWRRIDSFVDFAIASVYYFYETPDSIYYLASNIEENALLLSAPGNKPLYAYVWLRLHDHGQGDIQEEISPQLAEAAAILPYFFGAKGVVLWGHEPKCPGQPYERMKEFAGGLKRVAVVSKLLGRAVTATGLTAKEAWWSGVQLVRVLELIDGSTLVLAADPRQPDGVTSSISVRGTYGDATVPIRGRHCTIAHIISGSIREF